MLENWNKYDFQYKIRLYKWEKNLKTCTNSICY